MKKLKHIVLCGLILLSAVLFLAGCNQTVLDMRDYVTATFQGLSGHGTAQVELDREKLNSALDAQAFQTYIAGVSAGCDSAEVQSKLARLTAADCFEISLVEQYKNLKTHDAIAVKIAPCPLLAEAGETLQSLQKGLGIKLQSETFCLDAAVEKGTRLDLFADIESHLKYSSSGDTILPSLSFDKDYAYKQDGFTITRDAEKEHTFLISYQDQILCTYEITIRAKKFYSGGLLTMDAVFEDYDIENFAQFGYYVNTEKTVTVPEVGKLWNDFERLTEAQRKAVVNEITKQIEKTDKIQAAATLICVKREDADFSEQSKSEIVLMLLYPSGNYYRCTKCIDLLLSDGGTVIGGNKLSYHIANATSLEGAENIVDDNYEILQEYTFE